MIRYLLLVLLLSLSGCTATITSPSGKTVTYTVPSRFTQSQKVNWRTLGIRINRHRNTTIVLKWAGRGGDIRMASKFIRQIQSSKAKGNTIIFQMVGRAGSSHALVACFADRLQGSSTLMFHSAQWHSTKKYAPNRGTNWIFRQCRSRGIGPRNMFQLMEQHKVVEYYTSSMTYRIARDPRG